MSNKTKLYCFPIFCEGCAHEIKQDTKRKIIKSNADEGQINAFK
jgi:hypothetical protein